MPCIPPCASSSHAQRPATPPSTLQRREVTHAARECGTAGRQGTHARQPRNAPFFDTMSLMDSTSDTMAFCTCTSGVARQRRTTCTQCTHVSARSPHPPSPRVRTSSTHRVLVEQQAAHGARAARSACGAAAATPAALQNTQHVVLNRADRIATRRRGAAAHGRGATSTDSCHDVRAAATMLSPRPAPARARRVTAAQGAAAAASAGPRGRTVHYLLFFCSVPYSQRSRAGWGGEV